jgi:hypothetical protein
MFDCALAALPHVGARVVPMRTPAGPPTTKPPRRAAGAAGGSQGITTPSPLLKVPVRTGTNPGPSTHATAKPPAPPPQYGSDLDASSGSDSADDAPPKSSRPPPPRGAPAFRNSDVSSDDSDDGAAAAAHGPGFVPPRPPPKKFVDHDLRRRAAGTSSTLQAPEYGQGLAADPKAGSKISGAQVLTKLRESQYVPPSRGLRDDLDEAASDRNGNDDGDAESVTPPPEVTWSTSLFGDAFSDWAVVAEVVLCHPCNVAAQFTAALSPDPVSFAEQSTTAEREAARYAANDDERRPSSPSPPRRASYVTIGGVDKSSSSGDDSDAAGSPGQKEALKAMRDALPPLNAVPCVGVVILDVLYCGLGSMFFSYWVRNELARRFHLVPDVGYLMTDELHNSFAASENDRAARSRSNSPVQIGRVVNRERPQGGVLSDFREQYLDKDKVTAKAKSVAKQADRNLRKGTKVAVRKSAEYMQATVFSCLCWPCALCQTHRELERRGFLPVRYLSASKLASAYAASVLGGRTGLAVSRAML